jgi:hypothetical protein
MFDRAEFAGVLTVERLRVDKDLLENKREAATKKMTEPDG